MDYFPSEVLEHIFNYLNANDDRNSISLVCKSWFMVEKWSRKRVFIGNCYAASPERLIARFPRVEGVSLKGKPRPADIRLVPSDWGGFAHPWIQAMAKAYPGLEELRLKRMVVSDESLVLISRAFVNFQSLVLVKCEGFTTDGLAAIAANCRFLKELDLQENHIKDLKGNWLNCFPDTFTSLVSLNFSCLKGKVDMVSLEKLVARSPKLKKLKVNEAVSLVTILEHAPQLEDLGIGSFVVGTNLAQLSKLKSTVAKHRSISELSWFVERNNFALPGVQNRITFHVLSSICHRLTFLNLTCAFGLRQVELIALIGFSKKLQRLWVLDYIGDNGLHIVASSCKDLLELRVYPYQNGEQCAPVSEEGLVAVSKGCPMLHSLVYFCNQMTNAALITVSKNCPILTSFRLCILDPRKPDPVTSEPLDEGFGAIVQSCISLKRLSLSGLLTAQVFLYIGMYAEQLEILSVRCAGDTNNGMQYVLNGCKNLRKLMIRDSPFGDDVLSEDMEKYETLRSLWISSCDITVGGCKALARKLPMHNVEIINNKYQRDGNPDDSQKVGKLYVYRTLDGPRKDVPEYVWHL